MRELPGDESTFFPARFAAQDDETSKLRAYWFVPCSMLRPMHYTRQLTHAGSPRSRDEINKPVSCRVMSPRFFQLGWQLKTTQHRTYVPTGLFRAACCDGCTPPGS